MTEPSNSAKQLQKQCSKTLLALLDDMFASCDDLYFDLASRATNNVEQNLYFESMREVRIKTSQMREDYQLGLGALFDTKLLQPRTKTKTASDDTGELNLVDDEAMENAVALSAMQTRARATSKGILYELCCRMSAAYGTDTVDEDNNPLDPKALCDLFAEASRVANIEIKARIILFKQYERYVVNRLPEIYTRANTLLKDAGIPFTKQQQAKRPAGRRAAGTASPAEGSESMTESMSDWLTPGESIYQYGAPAFGDLNQLLASIRTTGSLSGDIPWFMSGNGSQLPREELLNLLDTPLPARDRERIDIRSYLQQILSQGQPAGQMRAVQQIDEDVINLVAMFFDFVLDDDNIPAKVKALVSRLQMPILKIALRDKGFFSNAHHPARELINEFARLSIGVDDETKSRELLEKIDTLVHGIQDNTGDPVDVFTQSLQDLASFGAKQDKRATLVEKRTKETEKGKAKTQIARAKSQAAIQDAMDGKSLPVALSRFIVNDWQEALFSTYLRDGDESPQWLEQLQTMQDLIWCSQPHTDEKSHQRLSRIRPELYEKLREGLTHTTMNDDDVDHRVAQVSELHDALIAKPDETSDFATFDAKHDERLQAAKTEKPWKEMTALERQKVQYQALTYEYIEKAEAIPVGSWLEFKDKNSGTLIRSKLASKLEESDTYIFVNRLAI